MIDIGISVEDEECIPLYATKGAAGADVRAWIEEEIVLGPGEKALVWTGITIEHIPEGYEIQVRPRSGLAFKKMVTVLNSPGTVDADYRGKLQVILINHGKEPFVVEPKMRIAQIVVAPVIQGNFSTDEMVSITERGGSGFGHTGTH